VLAALPANNSASSLGGAPGAVAYDTIANNYSASPRGTIQADKGDARVDQTFNQRWSMFARYSQHNGTIFDPPTVLGPAGGNANSNVHLMNRQVAGGVTWVIAADKLLDVRFAYTENVGGKTPMVRGRPLFLPATALRMVFRRIRALCAA